MGVFISWSDENSPSHELAKALDEWIPSVVQNMDCYLSSKDTVAGTLWSEKMMKELGSNNVGIVCLYAGNLENRWIHFEAGAIAAKTGQARLCPLLIGLKKTSVPPPLGMYQVKTLDREEMFSVMQMINDASGEKGLSLEKLRASFDVWWQKLEPRIQEIKSRRAVVPTERADREILEEILESVRSLNRPSTRSYLTVGSEHVFPPPGSLSEAAEAALMVSQHERGPTLRGKLAAEIQKTDPALAQSLSDGVVQLGEDQPLTVYVLQSIPEQRLESAYKVAASLGIKLKIISPDGR